jgi:hypothetical protein
VAPGTSGKVHTVERPESTPGKVVLGRLKLGLCQRDFFFSFQAASLLLRAFQPSEMHCVSDSALVL